MKFLCSLIKKSKVIDHQVNIYLYIMILIFLKIEHKNLLGLGLINNIIMKYIDSIEYFPVVILDLIKDELCKNMIEVMIVKIIKLNYFFLKEFKNT